MGASFPFLRDLREGPGLEAAGEEGFYRMELLLTGSTGFVGRNLLLRLAGDQRWNRIVLPVRDPEKLRSQLEGEGISDERILITRVTGDFWELPSGIAPDLVIHAAGLLFGRRKEDYFGTNVDGSILSPSTVLPS